MLGRDIITMWWTVKCLPSVLLQKLCCTMSRCGRGLSWTHKTSVQNILRHLFRMTRHNFSQYPTIIVICSVVEGIRGEVFSRNNGNTVSIREVPTVVYDNHVLNSSSIRAPFSLIMPCHLLVGSEIYFRDNPRIYSY